MIFEAITEKLHERPSSDYISGNTDISAKEFVLPMPDMDVILNQRTTPTCISHAAAMAAMVTIYGKTNKWVSLSPFSLHGYFDNDGGGGTPWYYAELLCRFGILPTSVFSSRGDNPELHEQLVKCCENIPDVENIAAKYAATTWAKLSSFDDVKRAIAAGYAVIGSLRTGKNFGKVNGGIEPVTPSGTNAYHAVMFRGWKEIDGKEYLIAVNSYGSGNGDKGQVYIPRGRMLKELTLIDLQAVSVTKKCKRVEFRIGSSEFLADDKFLTFEAAPYIKRNRTYLPVRFVAENLGAVVDWNADAGVATINSEEAVITMTAGSEVIVINGKAKKIDVTPEIVEGRMMCPIRHIAEALNCKVEWLANENKAVITAL